MQSATGDRNYKADTAGVFAILALVSLLWFGLSWVVDLPFTFGADDYTASIFPAIGFGMLAIYAGGFSWISFPNGVANRDLKISWASMLAGALVVSIVVIVMIVPEILNINLDS